MIKWPINISGWKMLFWIYLGRCPIHHTRLNIDYFPYDDGKTAYCFKCDNIGIWPQTATEALRQNYLASQINDSGEN